MEDGVFRLDHHRDLLWHDVRLWRLLHCQQREIACAKTILHVLRGVNVLCAVHVCHLLGKESEYAVSERLALV